MSCITKGRRFGVFAGAQAVFLGFRHSEFHRGKIRALMRTVAKWLVGGTPAGTPPIASSSFQLYHTRFFLRDYGVGHVVLLMMGMNFSGNLLGNKVGAHA